MQKRVLEYLLDKLNTEKIEGLSDLEQMSIFAALEELSAYKRVGSVETLMMCKEIARGYGKSLGLEV